MNRTINGLEPLAESACFASKRCTDRWPAIQGTLKKPDLKPKATKPRHRQESAGADDVSISLLPIRIIDPRDCFAWLAKATRVIFQHSLYGGKFFRCVRVPHIHDAGADEDPHRRTAHRLQRATTLATLDRQPHYLHNHNRDFDQKTTPGRVMPSRGFNLLCVTN